MPSHPWEHLQQPLTGGDNPEPISAAKLLGLSRFFLPVPLLDGKAENWGRQFGRKRSHHLCHRKRGISFPAQPVLAWVCSSVSNIVGELGTDGVRGLASLALCAAGLRISAGPGTGLRWERRALFLSCLLPRATPGSILARSGCEAAVEHLLKTSGTTASPGCKPQRSPALSPRVPWAQQYRGVQVSLLSSIHPQGGFCG